MGDFGKTLVGQFRAFVIDNLTAFPVGAIPGFIFNLLLTAVLAFLLGRVYVRHGRSMSDRRAFAHNFVNLAVATMFVIAIVKSSLALSLGLVGALSIVRFRAAIKEPEELTYLFFAIAIGLGCGAGHAVLTTVAFLVIFLLLRLHQRSVAGDETQHVYVSVTSGDSAVTLESISAVLAKHCQVAKVKRTDVGRDKTDASFAIVCDSVQELQCITSEIRELDPAAAVSYIDSSRQI
jgi:hypothetical protein